jgi:hypothetical protein
LKKLNEMSQEIYRNTKIPPKNHKHFICCDLPNEECEKCLEALAAGQPRKDE